MTIGGVVAIFFLLVMVAFVIRGISGHKRSGDTSDSLDSSTSSGDGGAGDGD